MFEKKIALYGQVPGLRAKTEILQALILQSTVNFGLLHLCSYKEKERESFVILSNFLMVSLTICTSDILTLAHIKIVCYKIYIGLAVVIGYQRGQSISL